MAAVWLTLPSMMCSMEIILKFEPFGSQPESQTRLYSTWLFNVFTSCCNIMTSIFWCTFECLILHVGYRGWEFCAKNRRTWLEWAPRVSYGLWTRTCSSNSLWGHLSHQLQGREARVEEVVSVLAHLDGTEPVFYGAEGVEVRYGSV